MKRFVVVLLAVLFCCSIPAAGPARADIPHAAENMYAQADYLVFSPEYSDTRGRWEIWVLAYRTGAGNHSGSADDELDQCVSASLLPRNNSGAAAGTISAYMGTSYELEDMMDMEGIRYYMYYDFWKPCYLASPGGGLTSLAKIDMLEIHETRENQRILIGAKSYSPSFALLCQFWLYAGRFNQMPSSVTKTYGMDPEQSQPAYSNNVSDYCSNQEQLQRYCDSLIPAVNYVSSSDAAKPHSSTNIYYRKGGTEFCVSPSTDGIVIYLDSPPW